MREWIVPKGVPTYVELESELNELAREGWTIFKVLVTEHALGVVAYRDKETNES